MKNKIKLIGLLILIIISLFFLIIYNKLKPETADTPKMIDRLDDNYLSITVTSKDFFNYFYLYDISSGTVKEFYSTKDTSQYPLGYINDKNKDVFYSYRFKQSDQLVKYNVETGETIQLTDFLYAINEVFTVNNNIYLLAKTASNDVVSLIRYNENQKNHTVITEKNMSVRSMSYVYADNSIYFSCYDKVEQKKLQKEFEDNESGGINRKAENAIHYIKKYNCYTEEIETVLEINELVSFIDVSDDGNLAIIRSSDGVFGEKKVFLYDINNKKQIKEIVLTDIVRTETFRFSENGDGIFFTGINNNDSYNPKKFDSEAPSNKIFYIDLHSNEVKEIISFNNKYINNFINVNW